MIHPTENNLENNHHSHMACSPQGGHSVVGMKENSEFQGGSPQKGTGTDKCHLMLISERCY